MGGTHLLQAGYYRSLSAWRGCFLFWKVFHLKRIISGVLLDILPHASGFLYAEMSFDKTGNEKVYLLKGLFPHEPEQRVRETLLQKFCRFTSPSHPETPLNNDTVYAV